MLKLLAFCFFLVLIQAADRSSSPKKQSELRRPKWTETHHPTSYKISIKRVKPVLLDPPYYDARLSESTLNQFKMSTNLLYLYNEGLSKLSVGVLLSCMDLVITSSSVLPDIRTLKQLTISAVNGHGKLVLVASNEYRTDAQGLRTIDLDSTIRYVATNKKLGITILQLHNPSAFLRGYAVELARDETQVTSLLQQPTLVYTSFYHAVTNMQIYEPELKIHYMAAFDEEVKHGGTTYYRHFSSFIASPRANTKRDHFYFYMKLPEGYVFQEMPIFEKTSNQLIGFYRGARSEQIHEAIAITPILKYLQERIPSFRECKHEKLQNREKDQEVEAIQRMMEVLNVGYYERKDDEEDDYYFVERNLRHTDPKNSMEEEREITYI